MNSICPKCDGHMTINEDSDLTCLACGAVLYLRRRRFNDTRVSTRRDNKKKVSRRNMDSDSKVDRTGIRGIGTPNNRSKVVRQGGFFRKH